MNSMQAGPPRFLPTLTEIVQPGELSQRTPATPRIAEDRAQTASQPEDRGKEQVGREELDSLVRDVVAQQVEILRQELREELQSAVRAAVAQGLTGLKNPSDLK